MTEKREYSPVIGKGFLYLTITGLFLYQKRGIMTMLNK